MFCSAQMRSEQRRPRTPNAAAHKELTDSMANEARTRVPSAAANGKMGHSLISEKKFRQLYTTALTLQMTANRANGAGAAWLRGREAVLAGVTCDLRENDVLVASGAGLVHGIVHGHASMQMQRRGLEERVIEALSDTVGDRMRKTGRITVIFPDGTLRREALDEVRSLAIAARLPVLLVEDRTKSGRLANKDGKVAWEYPSIPVDTQDVIAVYRVAHESIARAREGAGPTHIVGVRWALAATNGKRAATSEDPVKHLEHWLMARGLPAQEWRREIVAEFETNRASEDQGMATRAIA